MKILIISLSTGNGHVEAGKALDENLKLNNPNIESLHINAADYINDFLKISTVDSYNFLVNYYPKLWSKFFYFFDNKKIISSFNKTTSFLRKINANNLFKKIKEFQPDKIISTHFIFNDLLLSSKYIKKNNITIYSIVTDYYLHNIWITNGIKKYFVASEEMKKQFLKKNNLLENNVVVSGIPIKNNFYKTNLDLPNLNLKLNNNPYILIMAGSCGKKYTEKILNELNKNYNNNLNIITVCGKNKKLFKKINKIKFNKNLNIINFNFTDKIPELMQISKLIISKSGGLTTTEAIVSNTPLLVVKPIPGQEEANARYTVKNDYGKLIKNKNDIIKYINFYCQKDKKKIEYKNSAKIIIENILK